MSGGDYGWGAPEAARRREDDRSFGKGLAYALLVVPIAVPVWLIIWQSGWISSIVAFGTAFGAAALYRYGSKGHISTRGAVAISVVSFATILLCVMASMLLDAGHYFAPDEPLFGGLAEPGFWSWLAGSYLTDPEVAGALGWTAALSLFLGALGALPTLIALLRGRTAGARIATMIAPAGVAVTSLALLGLLAAGGHGGDFQGGRVTGPALSAGSGGSAVSDTYEPALPAGSCLNGVDASGQGDEEYTTPDVVACDLAHDAEVVHVGAIDDAVTGPDYPGAEWMSDHALEECAAPVSDFLGVAWDESGYGLQTVYPSEGSWNAGDRAVACWVQNPDGPTTGTLRGAGTLGTSA